MANVREARLLQDTSDGSQEADVENQLRPVLRRIMGFICLTALPGRFLRCSCWMYGKRERFDTI